MRISSCILSSMPTATSTITKTAFSTQTPLKPAVGLLPLSSESPESPPSPLTPSTSTTAATLRTLYNRAARAFLLRDIPLTDSLLSSALALLHPPSTVPDALNDHRRKWDILRITLDSTVYASPPTSHDGLPERLRANLTESPQTLITAMYSRSLALFTPENGSVHRSTSNAAFLPTPVLITLIYSSLKIDCADVGRVMIEDWLAHREPHPFVQGSSDEADGDGYAKVLELYCLHVLPKLEQWDYAKEFLDYEEELPVQTRENLASSLKSIYAQTLEVRRPPKTTAPSSSTSSSLALPRPYSPSPSSSSSSSSLSTTSTHTVVPATPRPGRSTHTPSGLTYLPQASLSSTSVSSNTTATPRASRSTPTSKERSRSKARTTNSSSSTSNSRSSIPTTLRSSHNHHLQTTSSAPSTYAIIKAALAPYLTTPKLTTFIVLFVLFPVLSFVLRIRHRRKQQLLTSNADAVRRRLQANGTGDAGVVGKIWGEVVRAVTDTVKMAGSGLV